MDLPEAKRTRGEERREERGEFLDIN